MGELGVGEGKRTYMGTLYFLCNFYDNSCKPTTILKNKVC